MDEIEMNRMLDLALPEIDRQVHQILGRLDAATGSVTIRKALHAKFVDRAIQAVSVRFPDNEFLTGATTVTPLKVSMKRREADTLP